MQYKNINQPGLRWSIEQLEAEAANASAFYANNIDQYLKDKGYVLENTPIGRDNKSSVDVDEKEVGIQHATEKGFLEASEFAGDFKYGFGGLFTDDQETRVVDYLNEAYSQYDNITFDTEGFGSDSVGVYIDGEHVETVNLSVGKVSNKEKYYEIRDIIDEKLGSKGDPSELLKNTANSVEVSLQEAISASQLNDGWGLDNQVEKHLKKTFADLGMKNFKVVRTDYFGQSVKITNNHDVSRTFSLDGTQSKRGSGIGFDKSITDIKEFILSDSQKTNERVNLEMDFSQFVKDRLDGKKGDENIKKLNEHGSFWNAFGFEGEEYQKWEDVLDKEGGLDSEDGKRFIDLIFDDLGIRSAWFDDDNKDREKFSALSNDQMKIIIKDLLKTKAVKQKGEKSVEIASNYINELNKGAIQYFGEGAIEKKGFYNTSMTHVALTSEGVDVSGISDLLNLFNLDVAETFETEDQRNLAESVVKLKTNLSESDREFYTSQANIAISNLADQEFVQFIDKKPFLEDGVTPNPNYGERISVNAEALEFFQESNPNAVYNEDNLKIIQKQQQDFIDKKSGGNKKKAAVLLEEEYNKNVIDLLSVKHELKKKYKYTFAASTLSYTTGSRDWNLGEEIPLEAALWFYDAYKDNEISRTHDHSITVDGEKLSNEETTRFLERWEGRYNETLNKHEVLKEMYFLNIDPILTQEKQGDGEHYGALVVNSLGMILGEGEIYQKMWGPSSTMKADKAAPVMSESGFELSHVQEVSLDRTLLEMVGEGTAGSVGILLEFAVANKATAALRTAKLFSRGTRSINSILSGWRAPRYSNGIKTMTSAQVDKRVEFINSYRKHGMKMGKGKFLRDFKFQEVKNYWGHGGALLAESIIEGVKFASLPSSSGHRTDAFTTGFGFGFMGQALAPIFGTITKTGVRKTFGKNAPNWMVQQAKNLENGYQLLLKGPTSFIAGVEIGEVVKSLSNQVLGEHGAFSDYMEENWGDYSDPTQRLISNYIVGGAFGLSHHMTPTRVAYGKGIKNFRIFNEWRSFDNIKEARDEALGKNWETVDYVVAISPSGKRQKMSVEDFAYKQASNSRWRIEKGHNAPGQMDLKWELKEQPGDSKETKQRKKDEFVRNEEVRQIFENMLKRAEGLSDLADPLKGQIILEKKMEETKKWFKDLPGGGIDVTVAFGNNQSMGQRGSYEYIKDPKTGKIDKKKMKVTFNVDQISEGLMPHEVGHAGLEALFTQNARFKSEFLITMGNIAKKVKIGKIDGKDVTLYDKMVEKNGKWDVHNRTWENDRIAEHELFMYLAEELAKIENYSKLKESNIFGDLKHLIDSKLGGEMKVKYDLKIESEVVRFFGDYIESINKGSNILGRGKGGLKHLSDVISEQKTIETKEQREKEQEKNENLRRALEELFQSPEAPTTTLHSSAEINSLITRNQELLNAKKENKGKWVSKADEKEFNDNVKDIAKLKSLVEKVKFKESGEIGYEKGRSNDEIVSENTRLVKSAELLLEKHGGKRLSDLPDGPIKDALITNLVENNRGALGKVVELIKSFLTEKNVPKSERPTNDMMMKEAEAQLFMMTRNYRPKVNDQFGAYVQSWDYGMFKKRGTILKNITKGQIEGQRTGTEKLDTEGKFDYQKDFDLKGDYAENPNRMVLRDEIFKTGEVIEVIDKETGQKTGEKIETIDTKKQKEAVDELHGNFNELSTKEIIGTNFTNIRDFHKTFSGEKSHVIFTATGKKFIDKIVGKDKLGYTGNKWKMLYRMVSENQVVMMSGVKARKGVKGEEGRSIELRTIILNAKNSKGETFFEYTGKRTKEDATGSSVEIREKTEIPLNRKGQEMFLDFLSIEIVDTKVQQPDGGYKIVPEFKWKKGTTAAQKLITDALLQEVLGRNFVAQEMVTWIKETYKNNPELQQAMAEGQILGRLSGGSSKLFSEKLLEYPTKDVEFVTSEMGTEKFRKTLNSFRKIEKTEGEGIMKAFEFHFLEKSKYHSISRKDLKTIAKQLTKEFRNVETHFTIRPERLIKKVERAQELTTDLDYIDRNAGNEKYEHKKDWADETNIFEVRHGISRELTKELIKKWGADVYETMFLRGESGGSGVGVFGNIGELLSKGAVPGSLRFALWEGAHQPREQVEGVVAELKKEGFKIPEGRLRERAKYDLQGTKEALLKDIGFFGEKWDLTKFEENSKTAEESKEILKDSAEILRKMYNKGNGTIKANHVRMWVEMHFANMTGLGKKSASLALLPNMSPKELRKMWPEKIEKIDAHGNVVRNEKGEIVYESGWVLEHILPAQNVKARLYDYIINGGKTKKNSFELSLRDYHTTFIPKGLDKMVNEIARTETPSNWLPGMDVLMRYYDMAHSSDFNFGFVNPLFGKNNLKKSYDFHPNLTTKQRNQRNQQLSEQYREALVKLGLDKGMSKLNSENLSHLKNVEKALTNGRKKDAAKKGMSTWDFDDTLALTKSGVRARIPNADGTPKPSRKVVFLAGGAGSGKSNVIKKLQLEKQGFKIVNSDISLEWLKKNSGLPENMNDLTREQLSALGKLQHESRNISKRKMMKYKGNAEGVVVDGTGGSIKAMEKLVNEFKGKGYDVSMLFVETSLETALTRNRNRKERSLLDKIVEKNHEAVQGNKQGFTEMFGERFMEVKTDNLKQESPMPKDLLDKMNDFVSGYEKIRLDAEQFATEGKSILDKGGEFDFSEFNVVTGGSKGPFFQKALKRAKKFGNKDMFVLTARPPEAQIPIYEFLKSQGLEIPLENIKGLGNSTGEAKALWMLEKFAEGYNDMYFADDAMQNVKAVKDVLSQLDIKSKVQQARRIQKEVSPEVKEKRSLENVKDINKLDSESYDNILYSEKHRAEYEKTITKHRPDLVRSKTVSKSVDEMFDLVESLNVPDNKKRKYEQLTIKWLATSNIKPKEDGYKIKDAVELAEKYKEDIFSYRNPNEIIEKYAGKAKEKPTDPRTVKEFDKGAITNGKHGITEHVVAETKEGQEAVRKVIDTHWGENSNPWCITQKKGGKLTEEAWDNWTGYSKGPKSIIFQNGKLLAFKANKLYWDRMDNDTKNPVVSVKEGRITKKVELTKNERVKEVITTSKDGNTITTEYKTETNQYGKGTKLVEERVNGKKVKTSEVSGNGTVNEVVIFGKDGKATASYNYDFGGNLEGVNRRAGTFELEYREDVASKVGDFLSRETFDYDTRTYEFSGTINLDAHGIKGGRYTPPTTEIGWRMPESSADMKNLIKIVDGKVRVDLEKVLEVDPDAKGIPSERGYEPVTYMYSENLSKDFNKILEEVKGIGAEKTYGEAKGRLAGKDKGKWRFFGTPGAEDFAGLVTYAFAGKGKKGEAHKEFFEENLQRPFNRAYNNIHARKQGISNDYKALRKEFKSDVTNILSEKVGDVFTVDHAIRVYNWTRSGFEVPGLSKVDLKMLNDFVAADPKITAFAENLRNITQLKEGYIKPKDYWLGENITMDMNNVVDRVYRKDALEEFTTNREAIFGKWENGRLVGDNMNKIEAAYGSKHREALENILWRMEKGTNRTVGQDSNTNKWMNWVNSATGTIMFFNQKSAALQTISSLNYVNGSFNNPFRAAQAFANQPQYWGDFMKIINSDMLLQRRSGLKINVEASELIDRVGGGDGAFAKFRAVLLEKGFMPTKWADSFAIASGGATYYRNSIRRYKKDGLNEKEAEARAWEDFTQMTEATQQSSRPDLVSMQQASALGRPILAFANTPMQMFRRHKRRIQDITNNRGNMAENVLSAVYYGFAQTLIFSFLANAMFAVDDESDDPKDIAHAEKQKSRHVNTILDSYLRGMGTGGAGVSALKNGIVSFMKETEKGYRADYGNTIIEMLNVSPPIGSKARKLYTAGKEVKHNKEEMIEMGLDFDNPAVMAIANVISAVTNIPVDRVVKKTNNVRDASMGDFETWQRVAMFMGVNKYSLGLEGGPSEGAVDASSQRIALDKKMEEYGVTTEEEVIKIDKQKEFRKLSKSEQQKILQQLKYDTRKIRLDLRKEQDRVDALYEIWKRDPESMDSILNVPMDSIPEYDYWRR